MLTSFSFYIKTLYPVWYIRTMIPRLRKWVDFHPQAAYQEQIIKDLKRNGIAITHIDNLFPGKFEGLQNYANSLVETGFVNPFKPFWLELWKGNEQINEYNPFVGISLAAWTIANAYLGCFSKLYAYRANVSRVMPKDHPPIISQAWHRDHEDMRLMKMFIYLTDVDENSGPFHYVLGSHRGGKWYKTFPRRNKPPFSPRPTDKEFWYAIPDADILQVTGKAGTVIFADTMGLHKGGYCTEKERMMSMSAFSTNGRFHKDHLTYKGNLEHYACSKKV